MCCLLFSTLLPCSSLQAEPGSLMLHCTFQDKDGVILLYGLSLWGPDPPRFLWSSLSACLSLATLWLLSFSQLDLRLAGVPSLLGEQIPPCSDALYTFQATRCLPVRSLPQHSLHTYTVPAQLFRSLWRPHTVEAELRCFLSLHLHPPH